MNVSTVHAMYAISSTMLLKGMEESIKLRLLDVPSSDTDTD